MLYYSYLNCMIVLYFLFIAYVRYNFYAHFAKYFCNIYSTSNAIWVTPPWLRTLHLRATV
jgi:hypothetical protein